MAKITKRLTKGSSLSYAEHDANVTITERISTFKDVGASYTASVNECVIPDNSSAAATVTLDGSPADGDFIIVRQKQGRPVTTNKITVARNGNNIAGTAADFDIQTIDNRVWMFVYEATGTNWEVDIIGSVGGTA